MEPDQNQTSETTEVVTKSRLHEVTPVSKYLALALFVALPFLGGYVGYQFAPTEFVEVKKIVKVPTGETLKNPETLQVSESEADDGTFYTQYSESVINGWNEKPDAFFEKDNDFFYFDLSPYGGGAVVTRFPDAATHSLSTDGDPYEYIEKNYIKNSKFVIYTKGPYLVPGADPETFEVTNVNKGNLFFDVDLARDKENFYFRSTKLEGLDLSQAVLQDYETSSGESYPVITDENHAWVPFGCAGLNYRKIKRVELDQYGGPC